MNDGGWLLPINTAAISIQMERREFDLYKDVDMIQEERRTYRTLYQQADSKREDPHRFPRMVRALRVGTKAFIRSADCSRMCSHNGEAVEEARSPPLRGDLIKESRDQPSPRMDVYDDEYYYYYPHKRNKRNKSKGQNNGEWMYQKYSASGYGAIAAPNKAEALITELYDFCRG